MIKGMLDTNILVYLSRRQPPQVLQRLRHFRRGEIVISSIVWAEFSVGLHKAGMDGAGIERVMDILPFDKAAGDVFGALTARYTDRSKGFERLIAAHAIAAGVTLITNNMADFTPYLDDGLRLENWA